MNPGIFGEGVHISMSRQALEAIVGRVILDQEFRLALFADPEAALVGYEVTEEEMAALRSVDAESLDACASRIGRRVLASSQQAHSKRSFPADR
jgi:hypothetical protein